MFTVGLVQIGEMTWARRQKPQWRIVNGMPVRKRSWQTPGQYVYLPYSVGLLQAYAQQQAPDRYNFLLPIFKPTPVAEAVEHLQSADIVGFSAYVWNIRQSLAIAEALKAQNPDMLIVFGGPQVPDSPEAFLRENPFIDIVCHGEGERVFNEILRRLPDHTPDDVPSISYLNADDEFVTNLRAPRLRDLTQLPSPYIEGTFDNLIAANPDFRWLVMWETNRGCPFSCTFCDWGSATAAKVFRFGMDRLEQEINWFIDQRIQHLFVCDANFGIFPRDVEIARMLVDTSKDRRHFMAISVQNTKNATERSYQVQKIFSEITTAGVTLSLQSTDPHTLQIIRRQNISLDSFLELQRRYRRDGIPTYTDLILGLPGETYETFTNGISEVIDSGQHNRIALYNCSVLPNAEMNDPAYCEQHGIVSKPVEIIHEYEELSLSAEKEIREYLENVLYTASMPAEDWVRAKTFAWFVEMLHFNRLLQVVFVTLAEHYGVTYKQMIEWIMDADERFYPICAHIREQFTQFARTNQAGKPEYVPSEEYLGIWWPAHEFMIIDLITKGQLNDMYKEVEEILFLSMMQRGIATNPILLHDAILLNKSLIRIPFRFADINLMLSHNIWEFYQGVLEGEAVPLQKQQSSYTIDCTSTAWLSWESWYEDVVMRSYQRDQYLYQIEPVAQDAIPQNVLQIAGG